VDGSHIRTLLLTFFFRQMPELIERGHVFIAQPPLYKVMRGKQHQYLKDERALDDYLIEQGLDGAVLRLGTGEERAGRDLLAAVEEARQIRTLLGGLHSRYDRSVVEQAAIAGVLRPVADPAAAAATLDVVAKRLDMISEETERGWSGAVEDGNLVFSRVVRGVKHVAMLDAALLGSADARKIDEHAKSLWDVYGATAALIRKADEAQIHGPTMLFEAVTGAGRKGVSLQRYKGLGEMNPEQLWETTLDRNVRSLLQVRVRDLVDAEDIFTKLMGDVVEPRREFIQTNALSVANLDV
jgi:DNA gyrase subunit B